MTDYQGKRVAVKRENGVPYVIYHGKKLFFKRSMTDKKVSHAFVCLCSEQDVRSPHCYFLQDIDYKGKVVADVGAAEGIYAIRIIEEVKQLILFECDPEWIEAMELTFRPWKEKVKIINRFVGDKTEGEFITLDIVKADIEGAENSLIDGAKKLIESELATNFLMCTYHQQDDAQTLSEKLSAAKFKVDFTSGLMVFVYGKEGHALKPPYFRKGLLYASK